MTVTNGSCTLKKDANNLVGISIGGGAPLCPCLCKYPSCFGATAPLANEISCFQDIVQIFDNSVAFREGSLAAGDEIIGVNNKSVKNYTKVQVAKLIQSAKVSLSLS